MNQFYLISLSKNKITSISNVLSQTFKQKYTPSLSSLICQRNELSKYKANRKKQKPTKIVPYNRTINTSDNSFRDSNSTNKKHSFKVGISHSRNWNTAETKGHSASNNRKQINYTIDNFNSSNQIAKCLNFKRKHQIKFLQKKYFDLKSFKT